MLCAVILQDICQKDILRSWENKASTSNLWRGVLFKSQLLRVSFSFFLWIIFGNLRSRIVLLTSKLWVDIWRINLSALWKSGFVFNAWLKWWCWWKCATLLLHLQLKILLLSYFIQWAGNMAYFNGIFRLYYDHDHAGKCSRYNLVSLLGFNIIFQMLQCDYSHILLSTAENLCKCILKAQDLNYVTAITRLLLFVHSSSM